MFTTQAGATVSCITDNADGTLTFRLVGKVESGEDGKRYRSEREVVLLEPTAFEYATLRTRIIEADRLVRDQFPGPVAPVVPDDASQAAAAEAAVNYQRALAEWMRDRKTFLTTPPSTEAPDTAPYARVVIETIRTLAAQEVTIHDLPVDAFDMKACTALLEAWEAPLGGPADRPNLQQEVVAEVARLQDELRTAGTAPDSPATEPSSLPGTAPSTPSPPPTSTG